MINIRLILICHILIALFFVACADQRPLAGGPTDKKSPKIDSARYSTPNFQTNFREREIILTFNEWLQLKDAYNQVLISPPMKEIPDIKLKNKSVVVRFKEPLLENTTYTIQFGEAIADFTEGNVVENFRFVFSTGNVIDSLRVGGQLVDAISGNPVPKAWVMLYDNLADSVPLTERPLYISKTDDNGFFSLENIREDSFRVFALKDQNANYRYDQPSESIAFWEEAFFLTDSAQGVFKLRMFSEGDVLAKISNKVEAKGQLKIKFNQFVKDSMSARPVTSVATDFRGYLEYGKDTLLYWWSGREDSFRILLEIPATGWFDTVKIDPTVGTEALPAWAIVNTNNTATKGKVKPKTSEVPSPVLHPKDPLHIALSRPLQSIDVEKILWVDSAQNPIVFDLQLHKNALRFPVLRCKVPVSPTCTLYIMPEALTDLWGDKNADTLIQVYKVLVDGDLANLSIKVSNADSLMQYIVQLLDENENLLESVKMVNKKDMEWKYTLLEPKKYTVQVIHDTDANGVFTNGSYTEKRQPELVTISKPIALRKGWDNEMEVNLEPVSGKKKGKK